jgi:hypothetical protein
LHDRGDLVDIEIAQQAKQQDFGLVTAQRGRDQCRGFLTGQRIEGQLFGALPRRMDLEHRSIDDVGSASHRRASVVRQSATGNGEKPGPKVGPATFELADPRGHRQPHLAREVVRGAGLLRDQKPQQARLELHEQPLHGALIAALRSRQQITERLVV